MKKMENALAESGFLVRNTAYRSREKPVGELASEVIPAAVAACNEDGDRPVHFVTHSLGGILIRYFLETNEVDNLGRIVMLSPPNQGSELVDKLGRMPGFRLINGPAGLQLGTSKDDLPAQMGPATFDVGIITGSRSINLILSTMIPGADDGKVSVQRARLEGMSDFLVVPHSHPFIMKSRRVIRQVTFFLENGLFDEDDLP